MRPRIHIKLSADDRTAIRLWSRRMLIVFACIAMLFATYVLRTYERGDLTAHDRSTPQQAQSASYGGKR
jgi:ribosomal protein S19